MITAYTDILVL